MVKIWERTSDINFAGLLNAGPSQNPIDELALTNEWICTNEIAGTHKGAIWRVAWADPEFGGIIASCGYDQFVRVYKEKEIIDNKSSGHKKNILSTGRTWNCLQGFPMDAPIRDIKFAPRFFGLVLAVACANGNIKLF